MNKADWDFIKNKLSSWESVKLECDGYKIHLTIQRADALKLAIIPYINGELQADWIGAEKEKSKEIQKRFLRPVSKYYYSAKIRNQFSKTKKRAMQKNGYNVGKKFVLYHPYWYNINSLIRHLKANNTNIKLL